MSLSAPSETFLTDANGFDLMERKVFTKEMDEFYSSSFYPIASSITMQDKAESPDQSKLFTVWNDRP